MDYNNILDEFVNTIESEDLVTEFLVNQCITASAQTDQLLAHVLSASAASSSSNTRSRSVVAHVHPGNLLDFIGDQPRSRSTIAESAMWKNLPPKLEDQRYVQNFRLSKVAFHDLLCRIRRPGVVVGRSDDQKACVEGQQSYNFKDMLAITLYYLAHCPTFNGMRNVFGCGLSTAWTLVGAGVTAIVRALLYGIGENPPVMKWPDTDKEILNAIGGFESFIGHLPWCMGAIDGTHIAMRKPDITRCPLGRDQFFGAKKVTQVMEWIVDARGRALYATFGHPGSSPDARIWLRDELRAKLDGGALNSPVKEIEFRVGNVVHKRTITPYIVGDGAFVPRTYMMRCFRDENTLAKRVFNQALCDVRKVVEQAIGRLKMRWQFCHRNAFQGDPEFVKSCVMASVALHNFCMDYSIDLDDEKLEQFIREELGRQNVPDVQVDDGAATDVAEANAEFLANYILHHNM
jgi:DDE superfamily endonuclease